MSDLSQIIEAYQNSGLVCLNRMQDPGYVKKLAEANDFITNVVNGKIPAYLLREAFGTSDFPILLGDNAYTRLLGAYRDQPISYTTWCDINVNVPNFKLQKEKYYDSFNLLQKVGEGEKGEEVPLPTEGQFGYQVETYEESMKFSWEMMVNDDLNAFTNLPASLGRDARNTVEHFATSLVADVSGPVASFFNDTNKNKITTGLSVEGLEEGIQKMLEQKGPNGEPITPPNSFILGVSPINMRKAQRILDAGSIFTLTQTTSGSKMTGTTIENKTNQFGMVRPVAMPFLDYIAPTVGKKAWFLFAEPSYGRGAVELGFLRGIGDNPVVIKKADNAVAMGGMTTPFGSFESRSFEYKVIHAFGGMLKEPRCAMASDGSA